MASGKKQIQQLARQLFKLSLDQGMVSAERVTGVLQYLETHRPAHAAAVLKLYYRMVAAEIARSQAIIEHAGAVDERALAEIAAAMSRKYGRSIAAVPKRNDALLAGLRVRVGDDTYESSVAGQLATLAASV